MKLYNLPRNTKFTLIDDTEKNVFLLDHIDGMYSYCTTKEGDVIHIAAFAEVKQYDPT